MKKYILFFVILMFLFAACNNETDKDNVNDKAKIEIQKENQPINNTRLDNTQNSNEDIIDSEGENKVSVDTPEMIDYELIKPYEIGHIMVVMYHGIEDRPPYHRTEVDFKKDLQYMYDQGYRLISIRDYIDSSIDIPAGFSPIVLTFDDGLDTTFSLEEKNGELVPKEGTAVAILEDFAKEHPDFGKAAILYINGGESSTFKGDGTFNERLNWLIEHGYDIGNHTFSHLKLSELTLDGLQEEIGLVDESIKTVLPSYTVDSLTYPHGIRPKEEIRSAVTDGVYNGSIYHYNIGFREGVSGPMVAPMNVLFDPYNCPRVRGSEGEEGDLWWWFDYYLDHPDYKYISDGKVDIIAVPIEDKDKVNTTKLGDKELYLY